MLLFTYLFTCLSQKKNPRCITPLAIVEDVLREGIIVLYIVYCTTVYDFYRVEAINRAIYLKKCVKNP